tara:strand:- start:857 stop:2215 length:1359 start_codon:yes stop_codon:yes gene_type:complete
VNHLELKILNALRNYYKAEHKISLDNKSLKRFLGYWIHTVCIIYKDRIKGIDFRESKSYVEVANSLKDFVELSGTNNKWNKSIISGSILKSRDIKKSTIQSRNILNRIFKISHKIIMDARLNYFDLIKIIISGFIPLKSKWFKSVPIFSVTNSKRSILESYMLKEGIEKRAANYLCLSIPRVYIEGFDYYYNLYGGLNSSKKHIITSYSHFYSIDFLYIALFFNQLKITVIEHGTESLNCKNGTFDFEYNICDEFIGISESKLVLPKFSKLSKRKFERLFQDTSNTSNRCVIINVNMPKYLTDLRSMPNAHDFKDYMRTVNKTACVLDSFFQVVMKHYFSNLGWTDKELAGFGNFKSTSMTVKKIIKQSKLVCVTYPGSLFFDCLLNKLRVILVWNYNKYALADIDLQNILIDEKILFFSSIELKNHIATQGVNNLGIQNLKLKKFVSKKYL